MADVEVIFSDVCAREFLVCGCIFAGLALIKLIRISRHRTSTSGGGNQL
jgi:hypothetical protein